MFPRLFVRDLGLIKHAKAMYIMKHIERQKLDFCLKKIPQEVPDTLILCEHYPVYTIGMRAAKYTATDEFWKLKEKGAEIEVTNRGGLITFHGPGQLVCYPVINLRHFQKSMRWYIYQLEEVLIQTCAYYGITGCRTKDVGVWVKEKKIAAIGIHASMYITSHGIAINCNNDLGWFAHIEPCGIPDKEVTSISVEKQSNIAITDAKQIFLSKFSEVFDCEIE